MKKQLDILIPLLAVSVVVFLGYKGFGWENNHSAAVKNLDNFLKTGIHKTWLHYTKKAPQCQLGREDGTGHFP